MSCGSCEPDGVVAGECRCDGGQPKNFLRPCLLLLLGEQAAHGYELIARLEAFGFGRDPGGLYRMLRSMEREGLVRSHWEPSEVGPDRCQYHLTPPGADWLRAWAETLGETRRVLDEYLRRYDTVAAAKTASPVPLPKGINYDDFTPIAVNPEATTGPSRAGGHTHSETWRNR